MSCSDRTRLFCVMVLTYITTTDVTLSPASSSSTETDDFLSKIKSKSNSDEFFLISGLIAIKNFNHCTAVIFKPSLTNPFASVRAS